MSLHPIVETLSQLLTVDRNTYDKALKIMEKGFSDVHINEIKDEDLLWLYEKCVDVVENKQSDTLEDAKYNALKLLAYIAPCEAIILRHFEDLLCINKDIASQGVRRLFKPNESLLEVLDEVFREYTHRISEVGKHAEFTLTFQNDMQKAYIHHLFQLQDEEQSVENSGDVDSSDTTTDFGAIPAGDTRHHGLRHIRTLLNIITSGVLEKILYDEGYGEKLSPVDTSLVISGRYEEK